jgi:apolipoprotein N-acyltransferase
MTRARFYLLVWPLALLAGALTVYAFAPDRLFWLMPLSLAALAELSQRYPERAFPLGYGWGLAAYTANFHWIYNSLHDIAGLPAVVAMPLVLLLPAWLALFPAFTLQFVSRLESNNTLRWLVAFPAGWVLTEWLRGWLLTGFPWGEVGYAQITESPLAGYVPILGIHGATLLTALSAGALVLLARSSMRDRAALLALALVLWGGGAWLKTVQWTMPSGKPIRVALAQGNIPQSMKWDPAIYQMTLQLYYRQVANTDADLMILPETALPAFLEDIPPAYLAALKNTADAKHMALALGVPKRTPDGHGYLNAVVALTTPGLPYYAKDHLVPFGEYIPLPALTGWIYRLMNMPLSGFSSGGRNQAPLTLDGQQIAFNVCYEDSFGNELAGPAAHASMLANVSNLAWFGASNAMSQQLQLSQARALESGRPVLRATNTGMTAIVAPNGEITAVAAPNTRQVLVDTVQGYSGVTPYLRWGDAPILALAALLVLITGCLGFPLPQERRTRF